MEISALKYEVDYMPEGQPNRRTLLMARGFRKGYDMPVPIARALAFKELLSLPKHIYGSDLIAGSLRGLFGPPAEQAELDYCQSIINSYGSNYFVTNADHFAPDYEKILKAGVPGILREIEESLLKHQGDKKRETNLKAMRICFNAFRNYILDYAKSAQESNHSDIAENCRFIADNPPQTFRQALQLVWLAHSAFVLEGRYAMALGRIDQFLYPYFEKDTSDGSLDEQNAVLLLASVFYKIRECRYFGADDVVNICIGGLKPDGSGGVNRLSHCVLEAVRICNIPGPNLSARLYPDAPDDFLDHCLKVIGTGLGYPALMNDEINIPALMRYGYSIEDCRNYCMVGCIENFIPGKQPPWSDGRYNAPRCIEYALNQGRSFQNGVAYGIETPPAEEINDMQSFMDALKAQMAFTASEYMIGFLNENSRYNRDNYTQPFLSCFCHDCIGRGLDINQGGAFYPSAHGACCMGVGTIADSLAAVEWAVFDHKMISLAQLRDALKNNFHDNEDLRLKLLSAPKYGNNLEYVDKYARWYVSFTYELFKQYHTPDGGAVYTAIAANIQNISSGREVGATPDGRKSGEPLSDAASPMHGMDKNGPTAVINSVSKPDYTLVGTGSVVNQKYSPDLFSSDSKRAKLLALIKTYFKKGGQEIQINSVSREILSDAMEHPEKYPSLVVRVSGFSAYYITLGRDVQEDILKRTEHF